MKINCIVIFNDLYSQMNGYLIPDIAIIYKNRWGKATDDRNIYGLCRILFLYRKGKRNHSV